ncbi:hypothetical protein F1559_001825 [Cyanidiococcus yangmingshanensis]|uniref:Uncharacterized protein n=1 Tax=Cyanidiococcus yangmingshanensis TaxID=2690220 RepID=A0A7J7ICG0_9RHOD|nr:hypothetical protein F1559_001825 [Cyanidiococcus yangmingshanensis]
MVPSVHCGNERVRQCGLWFCSYRGWRMKSIKSACWGYTNPSMSSEDEIASVIEAKAFRSSRKPLLAFDPRSYLRSLFQLLDRVSYHFQRLLSKYRVVFEKENFLHSYFAKRLSGKTWRISSDNREIACEEHLLLRILPDRISVISSFVCSGVSWHRRMKATTSFSTPSATLRFDHLPVSKEVRSFLLRSQHSNPETSGSQFPADEHTDAFGRDPRKEAEAWRETAREVLEAKPVQDAIHKHIEQEQVQARVPAEREKTADDSEHNG